MGWGSSVFQLIIISAGSGFSGLFSYSPGPGAGNLIGSTGVATAGTDPYGNAYLIGDTTYTTGAAPLYAVNIAGDNFQIYTAATQAGPWSVATRLSITSAGSPPAYYLRLVNGGFIIGGGLGASEFWLPPSGDNTGAQDLANINNIFANGYTITHLLPGTFYFNGQLTMTGPQQLAGAGPGNTIIRTVAAASQYNVIATPDSASAGFTSSHGIIKGLTIDCAGMAGGAASNGNGNGLYLFGAIEWLVEDVEIINSPNWGIVLDSNANNDCFWTWLHRVNLGTGSQANAAGLLNGYNTNSRITECVLAAKSVATVAAQQPKYTPAPSNVGGVVLSNSADPKYTNNILGKGGSTVPTVHIFNIGNHFIGNYFLNSDTTAINDAAGNTIIDGNQFDQCVLVTANPLLNLGGLTSNPVTITSNVQTQGAGLATWAVQGAGAVNMFGNSFVAGSAGLTNIAGTGFNLSAVLALNDQGIAPGAVGGKGLLFASSVGFLNMIPDNGSGDTTQYQVGHALFRNTTDQTGIGIGATVITGLSANLGTGLYNIRGMVSIANPSGSTITPTVGVSGTGGLATANLDIGCEWYSATNGTFKGCGKISALGTGVATTSGQASPETCYIKFDGVINVSTAGTFNITVLGSLSGLTVKAFSRCVYAPDN